MNQSAPLLVDEVALSRYLDTHLPGDNNGLQIERIGEGHSNLTFLVKRGDNSEFVLRRPPRGMILPSTHDMVREYAFLSALKDSTVPVARPILLCEDKTAIGAVFYLMEYLPGEVIIDKIPPQFDNPAGRAAIAEETVKTMAAMHKLDYAAVGLDKIGKPQGYMERQVRRRREQLDMTTPNSRPLPMMEKVGDWLRDNIPDTHFYGIVHGDFRIGNMIFASDTPRVIGVLDWETATIGDPLVDLGYLLSNWAELGDPPLLDAVGVVNLTAVEGFPTRAEIIERYAELTKRKPAHLNFYTAFSIWKLAISLEGSYARHLASLADDPFFAGMKERVPAMAERAWEICQRG